MERKIKLRKDFQIMVQFVFVIAIIFNISCNKLFENKLPSSINNDTDVIGDGSKRVLYLILDGVKGSVVRSVQPENLTLITKNSIFTYDGLADYQRNNLTDAAAWTTMLTGVDYTQHQVESNDFNGFDNSKTPTIFSRLMLELGSVRTVSIASNAAFNNNLATDATQTISLSNDEAVKTAVIEELTSQDPSLLVAHFNGANEVGGQDYSDNNEAYVNAIQKLDLYVGEIMHALRNRKTYKGENWIVIIASNKGKGVSGGAPGSNIYDDFSRNTFVSFYNPRFTKVNYERPNNDMLPYSGTGPRFVSDNNSLNGVANLNSNTSIGNFGTTGEYTLMFKMRNDGGTVQYPMFVGKRNPENTDVGGGGWGFLIGGSGFQLDWTGSPRPNGEITHNDGIWHTMGFTIFHKDDKRMLSLFADGELRSTKEITNKNADNDFPFRIGTDSKFKTNILIRDLVILNTSLSSQEMITNMRKEFGSDNPYFKNVIGFWPGNENDGDKMLDHSGKGYHFDFSSTIQFTNFIDFSPNITPNISQSTFSSVPNGVDIPVFIYNWMNLIIPEKWGLMGKLYVPSVNLPID